MYPVQSEDSWTEPLPDIRKKKSFLKSPSFNHGIKLHKTHLKPHCKIPSYKFIIFLLNETNIYEEIQSLGFYKYEFLNKKIEIDGKNTIEILIIKDMKEDRKIILSILEASFVPLYFEKQTDTVFYHN